MKWTHFWDMHSGGDTKEKPYNHIFIEAKEDDATTIFYNRFGHNPNRVSCTCCGPDYSITEYKTLEQATGFERGCAYSYKRPDGTECLESEAWEIMKGIKKGYWGGYIERVDKKYGYKKYVPLPDFLKNPEVLVIYAKDVKPEERIGEVPEQGYVWQD